MLFPARSWALPAFAAQRPPLPPPPSLPPPEPRPIVSTTIALSAVTTAAIPACVCISSAVSLAAAITAAAQAAFPSGLAQDVAKFSCLNSLPDGCSQLAGDQIQVVRIFWASRGRRSVAIDAAS